MGASGWVSENTKLVVTIVLEIALFGALLRFVFRGRRRRALACFALVAVLTGQSVLYDFFVARPRGYVLERRLWGARATFVETRTRHLGIVRLRLIAIVPELLLSERAPARSPFRPPQPPVPQLSDRFTELTVGGAKLTGVDRTFLIGSDGSTHEVDRSSFSPLLYVLATAPADWRVDETPGQRARELMQKTIEICARTGDDAHLRALYDEQDEVSRTLLTAEIAAVTSRRR